MADADESGKRAGASERILRALAAEFPRLHDRQSFLDSPALPAPINCALFPGKNGMFDLTWKRQATEE